MCVLSGIELSDLLQCWRRLKSSQQQLLFADDIGTHSNSNQKYQFEGTNCPTPSCSIASLSKLLPSKLVSYCTTLYVFANLYNIYVLQAARRKADSPEVNVDDFNWQEHDRLESARLFSARSDCSSNASQANKHNDKQDNSSRISKSSSRTERSHHSAGSAAEEMLKLCYKRDDVSDMLEEMNFSDPKGDVDSKPSKTSVDHSKPDSGASGDVAAADQDDDPTELDAVGGAPAPLAQPQDGYVVE